ncbi:MAG: HEAT repeat domain-containing protein [Melioribacteraceae bacterium]|nr:HEAT repeat domain-containing protein [Melioribacteraceae bacterium]MCF8263835.1 HEAT repeat domain-containing protein [Melioribacteraceae bacterium]MCF8412516.1 HEAT repeat domain-containing protein [Melioribacteraceae bacterium]MCF8432181.1 HEAT repeat domain-containing protein [Melioribacteraceae bacterium]
MKKINKITAIFVLFLTTSLFAGGGILESPVEKSKQNYAQVEANLLAGLNSGNKGLSNSCAYYLGEIKSDKAVIPLMAKLRSGDECCDRIMAALSLSKIKDERGLYLLKQMAKFEDNERVRSMCEKFYLAHVRETLQS